jgi:hypothetical protein
MPGTPALSSGARALGRWTRTALTALVALATALGACGPTKNNPCVKGTGVHVGDTLGMTVVEPYDASSSYRFELEAFLGPDGTDLEYQQCNPDPDITFGERLTLDVVGRLDEEDETGCTYLEGSLHDSQKVAFGCAGKLMSSRVGRTFINVWHTPASISGCASAFWEGYVGARADAPVSPLAPLVRGEVPAALLWRMVGAERGVDPVCDAIDWGTPCLFVIELEKL